MNSIMQAIITSVQQGKQCEGWEEQGSRVGNLGPDKCFRSDQGWPLPRRRHAKEDLDERWSQTCKGHTEVPRQRPEQVPRQETGGSSRYLSGKEPPWLAAVRQGRGHIRTWCYCKSGGKPCRVLCGRASGLVFTPWKKHCDLSFREITMAAGRRMDCGSQERKQGACQEACSQEREDSGQDRGGRPGGGEKCADSGYILEEWGLLWVLSRPPDIHVHVLIHDTCEYDLM